NPFRELKLFPLRPTGLPAPRRWLVERAAFFGLPLLQRELDPTSFSHVEADLVASRNAAEVRHPAEVFDAKWAGVAGKLAADLGIRLCGVP
ncbi:MAG: hypothetical protein V2A73_02450, partial [Pseudomonadota bacterium]